MRRFSLGGKLLPLIAVVLVVIAPSVWSEEAAAPTAPEAVAPAPTATPATAPAVSAQGGTKMVANLANGSKIFAEGKGEAPACLSCHGEQGLGDDNLGTPRTAGQGFAYLRKQLYDFADDRRTDAIMGVMNGIAKALSEQDRLDVAAHEASLKHPTTLSASDMQAVKDGGAVPVGVRHLGKGIVLYGIPAQGVPACQSCHQYNGRGVAPIYPTIGGQRYIYLVSQLKAWRDGTRANDMLAQMQAVAKNMTDEDIYNVSTYLTSAPVTTIGNPTVPHDLPIDVLGHAGH